MKVTAEQAFELSKSFRELSVDLGDYRYRNWKKLKKQERQDLEDAEWSLLNSASDMTTKAVGLVLDEAEASFESLARATGRAKKAVKTLKAVGKVINVASAAVGLAAAVLSRDVGAVGKNAKALFDAATA